MNAVRRALYDLLREIDSFVQPSARLRGSGQVKLVFSFDEVDCLARTKLSDTSRNGNLFEALCSSLDVFRGFPIFFVFLSTNSQVALLAPPLHKSTSIMAKAHFDSLVAPFTETAFDCSSTFPLSMSGHTLEEIGTIDWTSQFGRPLYVRTSYSDIESSLTCMAQMALNTSECCKRAPEGRI